MKILIAGSDINSIMTALYIKQQREDYDIYMTTDENPYPDKYTAINIKETDINSIVDFVKYNGIELTIVYSKLAIINGIADEFEKEEFPILCPLSESARITYFNSISKKILYKLKIPTTRFGIFDRENLAIEYIRNSEYPILIQNDFNIIERDIRIYNNFNKAKLGIQQLFENNNDKIVIEKYIESNPYYMYFITDGYNAYPLCAVMHRDEEMYKVSVSPDNKISEDIWKKALKNIIYPLLDDIAKYTNKYTGILGIKAIITDANIIALEVYNNFENYDLQVFLTLLEEDLTDIYYAAAAGELAERYKYIKLSDRYTYTIAVNKEDIKNTEYEEEGIAVSEDSKNYIITTNGASLSRAKEVMKEYLSIILKEDRYKEINEKEFTKETIH